MPKVTFIQQNGEHIVAENAVGSLMEIARDHAVEGIDGDCGGVCSCSTCHVFVSSPWREKLEPASDAENDTLEFDDRTKENSRLSCQIEMTEDLDGLVVEVAPEA